MDAALRRSVKEYSEVTGPVPAQGRLTCLRLRFVDSSFNDDKRDQETWIKSGPTWLALQRLPRAPRLAAHCALSWSVRWTLNHCQERSKTLVRSICRCMDAQGNTGSQDRVRGQCIPAQQVSESNTVTSCDCGQGVSTSNRMGLRGSIVARIR